MLREESGEGPHHLTALMFGFDHDRREVTAARRAVGGWGRKLCSVRWTQQFGVLQNDPLERSDVERGDSATCATERIVRRRSAEFPVLSPVVLEQRLPTREAIAARRGQPSLVFSDAGSEDLFDRLAIQARDVRREEVGGPGAAVAMLHEK